MVSMVVISWVEFDCLLMGVFFSDVGRVLVIDLKL